VPLIQLLRKISHSPSEGNTPCNVRCAIVCHLMLPMLHYRPSPLGESGGIRAKLTPPLPVGEGWSEASCACEWRSELPLPSPAGTAIGSETAWPKNDAHLETRGARHNNAGQMSVGISSCVRRQVPFPGATFTPTELGSVLPPVSLAGEDTAGIVLPLTRNDSGMATGVSDRAGGMMVYSGGEANYSAHPTREGRQCPKTVQL